MISYSIFKKGFVPGRPAEFMRLWRGTPIRIVAHHMCVDYSYSNHALAIYLICRSMGDENLARFRLHKGTPCCTRFGRVSLCLTIELFLLLVF